MAGRKKGGRGLGLGACGGVSNSGAGEVLGLGKTALEPGSVLGVFLVPFQSVVMITDSADLEQVTKCLTILAGCHLTSY